MSFANASNFLGKNKQTLSLAMLSKRSNALHPSHLAENSPADKAGLKVGDVITHINNKKIKTWGALRNAIALTKPDQKITISILRDSCPQTVVATLGKSKDSAGSYPALKKIGLDKVTSSSKGGVLVKSVHPGSLVQNASVRADSIILAANNTKVNTPEELNDVVEKAFAEKRLLLLVRQGQVIRFINIQLDEMDAKH